MTEGGKKYSRKGSGPYWWLALVLIVFTLYSLTVAATTADDCAPGQDREWIVFPPEWECKGRIAG